VEFVLPNGAHRIRQAEVDRGWSLRGGRRVTLRESEDAFFLAKSSREDLLVLKELIEAGKIRPAIDRTYPLSETADALRYLEAGHARGKVVITV
jgi:NADPH:quinone reductase-like Zn-dependent oxidoreductase